MDVKERFEMALRAVTARDYATARRLLVEVVRAEPRHEQAWLMLASVIDDPDRAIDCLERVLAINPQNEKAQSWMKLARREKVRLEALAEVEAERERPEDVPLDEPGDEERPVPRLGRYLLDYKFITTDQLRQALVTQRRDHEAGEPRRLGDILLEQGAITGERLSFALREQHRTFYSLFDE